jgi:hypothetical protein
VSETGPGSTSLGLTTGTGNTAVTLLNVVTVPPVVTPTPTPSPTPTPTPTPSTFNFTQQYYGAFMTLSDSPYNQSTLLGYSWGQRTGVYDGYFYAVNEGTRTSPGGQTDFYQSLSTGTNTATSTGTVTGFLGQTLTGTMTWTSTIGSNTISRTGAVTILPTGELIYNWTDTVTGPGGVQTGTGTLTQTPGTYFTSNVNGQQTTTANLAGNQATTTNDGVLSGSRVMNGITSSIIAGHSVTSTALNANTFTSDEVPRTVNINSKGVLGAPDANGVRVGVMTSTVTTSDGTSYNGGPVRDVPASGANPAATLATVIADPPAGTSAPTLGIGAQTTNLSALIVTNTYEGSGTMDSSPPYTTGTFSSTGWGKGRVSGIGVSETGAYTGTMDATVTQTGGGTFTPGPEVIQHTSAAVVAPGSDYHGPAQGIGVKAPDTVISTNGTVTIDAAREVATAKFTGTAVSPNSKVTITAGTQNMTSGTEINYFAQTTVGAGAVDRTAPVPVPPASYSQKVNNPADINMSRAGPMGGYQVLPVNQLNITSTTNTAGALPPAATNVPAAINIQGVVNGSGVGNMTMTIHNPSLPANQQPVSTYMGKVNISTDTGTLTAPNLVGKNPANPGATVNRAPATQSGTVTTQRPPP